MTDTIAWLAPTDITPGTPLAADLTDADGNILLTAGTRLEPHRLAILVRQGITRLPVEPPPPAPAPQPAPITESTPATTSAVVAEAAQAALPAQDPSDREAAIRARLEQHFALAGDNPASRAMFHALLTYRLQQAGA